MKRRRIIRRPTVKDMTGMSISSIDREEKKGNFPQRVSLGANAVGWYEDEIQDWVDSRPRGGVAPPLHALAANSKHCVSAGRSF